VILFLSGISAISDNEFRELFEAIAVMSLLTLVVLLGEYFMSLNKIRPCAKN
jgi:hypothetical protein